MVLLLGSTGYIGSAFAAELSRRGQVFYCLSRKELDYSRFDILWRHLQEEKPSFVINAAGYTGKPNVDACEIHRAETLIGNTLFPQALAHACLAAKIPYGHVSSGCIYSGGKILENGVLRLEPDLSKPEFRPLIDHSLPFSASPNTPIRGFTESDPPNFSFRSPPCSFYSGTKALAEEAMTTLGGEGYLWRLRIPFDEQNNPRNYLTKVQSYPKVYDNVNSISHRGDFARACLDLWRARAPLGIYNVTNPGWITTRHVIQKIKEILKPEREFQFWRDDTEFYNVARAPRSNCVMDVTKLLGTGVKIRPIDEALEHSLRHWNG